MLEDQVLPPRSVRHDYTYACAIVSTRNAAKGGRRNDAARHIVGEPIAVGVVSAQPLAAIARAVKRSKHIVEDAALLFTHKARAAHVFSLPPNYDSARPARL